MLHFISSWNTYFSKRKPLFFFSILLLVIVLGWITTKITFKEDISSFIPETKETELINFVYKNNKIADKIIITLSLKDTTNFDENELMDGIDQLETMLQESVQPYSDKIVYQVNNQTIIDVQSEILNNLPVYISEKEYSDIEKRLSDTVIEKTMAKNKELLLMPSGSFIKENITNDPLHLSGNVLKSLQKTGEFQNFKTLDGYLFSKDSKQIFLFIISKNSISETKNNSLYVQALEKTFQKFNTSTSGKYKLTYFGAIPVSVTNAEQIKKDSMISMIVALALIIIILLLYFKKITHLILIIIPVLFGALLSLAFIVIFKGGISTIAIGASSAIFGIALNYSLHFLIHYKETNSIKQTIQDIAFPMIIGSITTVGAFLSLLFVQSDALKDFGIFSAVTLIGTLLFVLLILPLFFRKGKHSESYQGEHKESQIWVKIASAKMENIPFIGLIIVTLTILFFYFSGQVKFDTDFSNLSYMTKDQKNALEEINKITNINSPYLYHISYGKNLDEALIHYEKAYPIIDSLDQLGYFKNVQGIGHFLHSKQYQVKRIQKWNQFWEKEAPKTIDHIKKECDNLGLVSEGFEPFFKKIQTPFLPENIDHTIIKDQLIGDYIIETPERCVIVTLLYTNKDIAIITGSPLANVENTMLFNRTMSNESMVQVLYDDFNNVLLLCALLVSFFLIISFGRIELAVISLLPMIFGWIWILGLMGIFNIHFNIVNIILATFIFGLGDDYSIFMMEGLMQDYSRKKELVVSYKTAVILSAITMFIGLGTLIFSKHPAMRSLAEVSTIGMISVVLMSYTISPYLFKGLIYKKGVPRVQPITLIEYLTTIYTFTWFIVGCIALNLLIPLFLIPIGSLQKRKKGYHIIFCAISNFCTKRVPFVKYQLHGFAKEKFEKPRIIISNHQSHIDLTSILGLSPNIIALTNKWVWNLPFYALPLRFADFYPIADNFENSMDQLKKIVDKGYSILIFPEGTRSVNCDINRFHKGAFYLAKELQLDILPITLHGFGHILPKKEMCLRKGNISVHVGELIHYEDYIKNTDYQIISKDLRKHYTEHFKKIKTQIETAHYWKERVIKHYLYKGLSIEWQIKKQLKKNNNYYELIESLRGLKKVKFINSGYGELPYLAALVLQDTQIVSYEQDEERFSIAQNIINIPQNLVFGDLSDGFDMIIDITQINK